MRGVPAKQSMQIGSMQIPRSWILSAFSSRRQPEDTKTTEPTRRSTAFMAQIEDTRIAVLVPRDLTKRTFGLAIAVDWRSGTGLPKAFYAVAGDGTATKAAVSQWSFAALALSPCIKNSWPDTHSTEERQPAGQQYDACADGLKSSTSNQAPQIKHPKSSTPNQAPQIKHIARKSPRFLNGAEERFHDVLPGAAAPVMARRVRANRRGTGWNREPGPVAP